MAEIVPDHPLAYRREIAAPLFQAIRAGDSCAVIGPAGMGKSRLTQFLRRADAQQHYLAEQGASTLIALADCNRLAEISEWGLFELLLTVLTEESWQHVETLPFCQDLNGLRREAITSRDPILARRNAELAVTLLCKRHDRRLCIVLDEFDESYRSLPATALANLRALRDAHKYHVCYVLMLREHPARLRDPASCEGFYELFSRTVLGLGPYTLDEARRIIAQLEARKGHQLSAAAHDELARLSGGHPALLTTLFELAIREGTPGVERWQDWAAEQPVILEECRKIWAGLAEDEQLALSHLAHDLAPDGALIELLALKGFLTADGPRRALFSPLFTAYVLACGEPSPQALVVDESARLVWLGGHRVADLTAREFDLLAYLYRHVGQLCTRDQLLDYLYPDEKYDSDDSRIDTLVKRVRDKVEPLRAHPRYLLTIRGKGYRLIATPEETA